MKQEWIKLTGKQAQQARREALKALKRSGKAMSQATRQHGVVVSDAPNCMTKTDSSGIEWQMENDWMMRDLQLLFLILVLSLLIAGFLLLILPMASQLGLW